MPPLAEALPRARGPLDFCYMEPPGLWEGTPPERVAHTIDLLLAAFRRDRIAPLIEIYEELGHVQDRVLPEMMNSDARSHFASLVSVEESALPSGASTYFAGEIALDMPGGATVLYGNCVIRGQCRSGAPLDVDGMEMWCEGKVHVEGSLRNGKLHGRCIVRSMTRPACSVDTFFEDGAPHGRAMIHGPGGSYRGDTLGGHLSGKCRVLLEGCLSYEGGVMNGLPHGFGTLEWGSASQYRGHWHMGTPHGDGVLDGDVYVRHSGSILVRVCSLAKKCIEDLREEASALRNKQGEAQELRAPRESSESPRRHLACKICMSGEVRYASQPCGHLVWCEDCAVRYMSGACPLCRQQCTSAQRIYV